MARVRPPKGDAKVIDVEMQGGNRCRQTMIPFASGAAKIGESVR
jgi:hypothetical protein